MENNASAKIRVLNPYTIIQKDTVIGNVQFVDPLDIVIILPSESQLVPNTGQVRKGNKDNSDKGDNSSEPTYPVHLSDL